MSTYECIQLVTPRDPAYRAWVEWNKTAREQRTAAKKQRPTPTPKPDQAAARASFAREAEYVLRAELRRRIPVWDRRILRFAVQKEDGHRVTRYRELDVVALAGRRLYIFEIKATRRIDIVKRGIAQLRFVRDVLADSFLDVITTLIVVDTDATGSHPATPVTRYIRNADHLVQVEHLRDLTTRDTIHALTLTPADVEAIAPRRLDLSFTVAA